MTPSLNISRMEINKLKSNVLTTKKRSKKRLPTTNLENFSFGDYPNKTSKTVTIKPKDFIPRECSKHTLNVKEHVERTDNNIGKVYENKEEKLLNLIVKNIVKSTLEELYGKEGN
jgi:hypothetical protein